MSPTSKAIEFAKWKVKPKVGDGICLENRRGEIPCRFDPCTFRMNKYDNLIFVDVEATSLSPFSGEMTEFGAVHYGSRKAYHGILWEAVPDPEIPAKPLIVGSEPYPLGPVMTGFRSWLTTNVKGRPVFVSDNPAYDFMWINYYFDKALGENPFGHSGRRISDFWAGLNGNWSNTQKWKQFRKTPHDHNPVNDAMGNVEAFEHIITLFS